jgi:hypothetical protein
MRNSRKYEQGQLTAKYRRRNEAQEELAPAGGSPAWVRPGVKVWTDTTSGEPILCAVIKPDNIMDGEWLLESPAHGYAIQRHWRELEQDNTQPVPQ